MVQRKRLPVMCVTAGIYHYRPSMVTSMPKELDLGYEGKKLGFVGCTK